MTSFWEILKSSKSLKASDAFAELWGKSISETDWDIITITGTLPLTFEAKGEALKNYRLYGTSEGAGVETVNLWDLDSSWTNEQTDTRTNLQLRLTQYNGSTSISTTSLNVNANGHYTLQSSLTDVDYTRIYLKHNGSVKDLPIGDIYGDFKKDKRYIISFDVLGYDPTIVGGIKLENIMLTEGTTAPASYIPYGYQIPLTITSGVTENEFDSEIEQGNMFSGVDQPSTSENYYKRCRTVGFVNVEKGVTYTLKSSYNMWWYSYKNGVYYSGQGASQWGTTFTFIPSSNYNQIRIMFANLDATATLNISDFVNDVMLVKGSTAPDHYIPHRYTADYNLYIGSTKLGAEEYLDYGEQKIYKDVSGTLTPTDPPVPFPAIQTYQGENTLSSEETVGEVSVTGKIKEI